MKKFTQVEGGHLHVMWTSTSGLFRLSLWLAREKMHFVSSHRRGVHSISIDLLSPYNYKS